MIGEVIHRYKCDRLECDEEYIRESTKTLEKGYKDISVHFLPFMNMPTPQVIIPVLIISPLWVGSHIPLQGPSIGHVHKGQ